MSTTQAWLQNRIPFMLLLLAGLFWGGSASAVETEHPFKLVEQVVRATSERITSDQALIDADPNHVKTVIREELMPYVNDRFAARIVLGRARASKADKAAFYDAYREYLITSYASVFLEYNPQELAAEEPRDFSETKVITVRMYAVQQNEREVFHDFKVRRKKNSSEWYIYDVVGHGIISLLNANKAEFKGALRQNGGILNVTRKLSEDAARDLSQSLIDSESTGS